MWFRVDHDLCLYSRLYPIPYTSMHLISHHESTGWPLAFSVKTPSNPSLDLR